MAAAGYQPRVLAGIVGNPGLVDGPCASSKFSSPRGMAVAADGRFLYVVDQDATVVRKIDLESRVVSTLATGLGGGSGFAALRPGTSDLWVSTGNQFTVVNVDTGAATVMGAPATSNLRGVCFDATGANMWFHAQDRSDFGNVPSIYRYIFAAGTTHLVGGGQFFVVASDIHCDPGGSGYVFAQGGPFSAYGRRVSMSATTQGSQFDSVFEDESVVVQWQPDGARMFVVSTDDHTSGVKCNLLAYDRALLVAATPTPQYGGSPLFSIGDFATAEPAAVTPSGYCLRWDPTRPLVYYMSDPGLRPFTVFGTPGYGSVSNPSHVIWTNDAGGWRTQVIKPNWRR